MSPTFGTLKTSVICIGRTASVGVAMSVKVIAVGAAVEVVVPFAIADAAHPEQHRAGGIEPFPDRDLAVVLASATTRFGGPGFAAVRRCACMNGTIIAGDGVSFATAINAHQLLADGLEHRPRIVARHVLHDVGLWQELSNGVTFTAAKPVGLMNVSPGSPGSRWMRTVSGASGTTS